MQHGRTRHSTETHTNRAGKLKRTITPQSGTFSTTFSTTSQLASRYDQERIALEPPIQDTHSRVPHPQAHAHVSGLQWPPSHEQHTTHHGRVDLSGVTRTVRTTSPLRSVDVLSTPAFVFCIRSAYLQHTSTWQARRRAWTIEERARGVSSQRCRCCRRERAKKKCCAWVAGVVFLQDSVDVGGAPQLLFQDPSPLWLNRNATVLRPATDAGQRRDG